MTTPISKISQTLTKQYGVGAGLAFHTPSERMSIHMEIDCLFSGVSILLIV